LAFLRCQKSGMSSRIFSRLPDFSPTYSYFLTYHKYNNYSLIFHDRNILAEIKRHSYRTITTSQLNKNKRFPFFSIHPQALEGSSSLIHTSCVRIWWHNRLILHSYKKNLFQQRLRWRFCLDGNKRSKASHLPSSFLHIQDHATVLGILERLGDTMWITKQHNFHLPSLAHIT